MLLRCHGLILAAGVLALLGCSSSPPSKEPEPMDFYFVKTRELWGDYGVSSLLA